MWTIIPMIVVMQLGLVIEVLARESQIILNRLNFDFRFPKSRIFSTPNDLTIDCGDLLWSTDMIVVIKVILAVNCDEQRIGGLILYWGLTPGELFWAGFYSFFKELNRLRVG